MNEAQTEPRMKRKYTRRVPLEPPGARAEPAYERPEPMVVDVAAQREQSRETRQNDRPQVVARDGLGRVQVTGRDGELLSRTRVGHVDIFYIDPMIIPEGWSYEWKAYSVTGEPQRAHQAMLHANGWRSVPARRHDGVFMTPGHDGPVEQGGQMLMERPMVLTQEAREDAQRAAKAQVQLKQQALGENMPKGFTMEHQRLPNRIKTNFEAPDVSRPRLEIADDDA